jgi:ABC-type transporter Mla subunit MlaD
VVTQQQVVDTLIDQSVQITELRAERDQLRQALGSAGEAAAQQAARIAELEEQLALRDGMPTADTAAEAEGG